MGHSNYVISLIKFVGEKQHAVNFIEGSLFCKPWIYFKGIEDQQRGDKLELVAAKLKSKAHITSLNTSYNFWLEDADDRFSPMFCMYHLSSRSRSSSIKVKLTDERLREFGSYGVVIKNTGEFIDRLNRNLPGFSYGLIDYIDFNNLAGENRLALKNPILKKDSKAFEHQREFRIYNTHYAITNDANFDIPTKEIIKPNAFGASFFSIGDLSDIAEIRSMDELFHGTEIKAQNPISKNYITKALWWDGGKYQEV